MQTTYTDDDAVVETVAVKSLISKVNSTSTVLERIAIYSDISLCFYRCQERVLDRYKGVAPVADAHPVGMGNSTATRPRPLEQWRSPSVRPIALKLEHPDWLLRDENMKHVLRHGEELK